jgi:transposase
VVRIVQRSPAWLASTIALYNTQGPDGLADRRPGRSHRPFLLNAIQREALDLRLQSPPDDDGKWTSQKVADWIEATLGQPVHVTTGWNYLRLLTYTVQQPRPRHPQAASVEQQEAYKKKSRRSSTT